MNTKRKVRRSLFNIKKLTGIIIILLFASCSGLVRKIDEPVFITGGNNGRATMNCTEEYEAVPSSVINPAGEIAWFASFGRESMTYAKGNWSNWSAGKPNDLSSGFRIPVNTSDILNLNNLSGDSWSTYSATKNLAFFYFIGRKQADSNGDRLSCAAVAATSPENLETGEWTFPAVCISDERSDQGAILHIDATNTFYVASKLDADIFIQAFDDCDGAPGPEYGCPRTATTTISTLNTLQFSLAENPCTGNLIVVYRKNNKLRLRFLDDMLNLINEFVVRENQPYNHGQRNVNCTKHTIRRCGLGSSDCCDPTSTDCNENAPGTCLRANARPSIDTYQRIFNGEQICGAVVAYDVLKKGSDGNFWVKSRLDIVDVTTEQSPSIIAQANSTNDSFTWNQYMSYAVVSDKGPNTKNPKIAWFWLTDVRGPCEVIVEGATSINLGSSLQATGIISGPFPVMSFSSFGIGDYFRGMKGGDKDGSLFLSWGEPVVSNPFGFSNCTNCMGDKWNLSTKITRIRWERARKTRSPKIEDISQGPLIIKAQD